MVQGKPSASEEDVVICRCEDVTLAQIRELVSEGLATVDEVKRITRAGMGLCQGRTCRQLIMQEISRLTGVPMDQLLMPTFRPPTRPVKLGLIAAARECGGGNHD